MKVGNLSLDSERSVKWYDWYLGRDLAAVRQLFSCRVEYCVKAVWLSDRSVEPLGSYSVVVGEGSRFSIRALTVPLSEPLAARRRVVLWLTTRWFGDRCNQGCPELLARAGIFASV